MVLLVIGAFNRISEGYSRLSSVLKQHQNNQQTGTNTSFYHSVFPLSVPLFRVCVPVAVLHMCASAHTRATQRTSLDVVLQMPSILLLRQGLLLALILPSRLGWLAREPRKPPVSVSTTG